jgi:L-fuconolactonase
MRIDAHQHYWRYNPQRDSWITDEMSILRRDFLPADAALHMTGGVVGPFGRASDAAVALARQTGPLRAPPAFDGVVAVQADQSISETDFLLDLAARHPLIRGVVGWVDLRAPELREQLARWRGSPTLKGFRHIAQAEPDDFLARADVIRGIAALGEYGYSYDILIYPRQSRAAEQLVRQCPGVRFVLDHCAKPAIVRGEVAEWRAGIARLARHPNVVCKVSGLVTEAAWGTWRDTDLVPYLDAIVDAFGADRILFGSDWPVCLVAASYRDVVGVVNRWAERLTSTERALLFGGTASAVYHLEN